MPDHLLFAMALHFAAILLMIAFGVVYLLRNSFMPYHAVAVGQCWDEMPLGVRSLILALMRVSGAGMVAVAFLSSVVLATAFREGAPWALWAVPAGGMILASGTLLGMRIVARHTPAKPPMWTFPVASTLFLSGLLISWL